MKPGGQFVAIDWSLYRRLHPMLALQCCVMGSSEMGAEQPACLFGETVILECSTQIDQTENVWFSFAGLHFHQISELS